MVEVPRTESLVVEGVCAILLPVGVGRVVEGLEIRLRIHRVRARSIPLEIPPPKAVIITDGLVSASSQEHAADAPKSLSIRRVDFDGVA